MTVAYIGLGSNMGDKLGYIQQANMLLKDSEGVRVVGSSSLYETKPYGNPNQEWFLNAVLELDTSLSARDLLVVCQGIELRLDRVRDNVEKWGPRTIDLDILFYGDDIISTEELQIPHNEVHRRAFVLVPMKELNPCFIHPAIGISVQELYNSLVEPEEVYLYGTRV